MVDRPMEMYAMYVEVCNLWGVGWRKKLHRKKLHRCNNEPVECFRSSAIENDAGLGQGQGQARQTLSGLLSP